MNTLEKLLECIAMSNEDEMATIGRWMREARSEGWTGVEDMISAAINVHGELTGFWFCHACDCPVIDPAVFGGGGAAVVLEGDITLCEPCHEAAKEARRVPREKENDVRNQPEKQTWEFSIHCENGGGDSVAYAIGATEREAADDLCRRHGGESVAYSGGILGGKGGWVIVLPGTAALWVHRGVKLAVLSP